jgi:DNA-binding CsgD family transcriptional regulator
VDEDFVKLFPEHASQTGALLSVHEIFRELPAEPTLAEEAVREAALMDLHNSLFERCARQAHESTKAIAPAERSKKRAAAFDKLAAQLRNEFTRAAKGILDREYGQHGWNALRRAFEKQCQDIHLEMVALDIAEAWGDNRRVFEEHYDDWTRHLVRDFAQLDGFDVWLRSAETFEQPAKSDAKPQLSWLVPVRRWEAGDDWGEPPEGTERVAQPTHEGPDPRPAYLAWLRDTLLIFDDDATVKDEFRDRLEPACIEAADLNLSAARHKPHDSTIAHHRPPGELIRKLRNLHGEIRKRLSDLLLLVEGGTALTSEEDSSTDAFASLSSRERAVLELIAERRSLKEIASQLGVSTKTLETHRNRIMQKLSVQTADQLRQIGQQHFLKP